MKYVPLFLPHVPASAAQAVSEVLKTRWIGQGPLVDELERRWNERFNCTSVAVGSCTDALHLAYVLAGIGPGDEVIAPVFTCTATNLPLLYQGAAIKFADVQQDTLNVDVDSVRRLITEKTKAIVCVHYGGLPADLNELNSFGLPVVEDAAQAVGAAPVGTSRYTCFSFQAIKHIAAPDSGMLCVPPGEKAKADRLRWFGIDRKAKQAGTWANDITEVGYKYQMTDICAAMALAGLDELDETLRLRRSLHAKYAELLGDAVIGAGREGNAAWSCTILAKDGQHRLDIVRKLWENNVESDQVHYRNDRYTVFGGRRDNLPNMDAVEDRYLVLPLHLGLTVADVEEICSLVKQA